MESEKTWRGGVLRKPEATDAAPWQLCKASFVTARRHGDSPFYLCIWPWNKLHTDSRFGTCRSNDVNSVDDEIDGTVRTFHVLRQ